MNIENSKPIKITTGLNKFDLCEALNIKESIRTLQKKCDRTGEGGSCDDLDSVCQLRRLCLLLNMEEHRLCVTL